jgi:hypothetical protein
MYPYISFPKHIIQGLKDIELIASKAKIPTLPSFYNPQSNNLLALYSIYIAICTVAIVAFLTLINKNILITIICFNVILLLVGIINFGSHFNQLVYESSIKNNNHLYKKNITLKNKLFENLAVNREILFTLLLRQQPHIENDSFNEFLLLNNDVNSFINRIDILFLDKVYKGVKFDIDSFLSSPIVIIDYTPIFIAIFIDIPYRIEDRNDDYLRVKNLSNIEDEYILNRLGLISIAFSEEQIVKNMLGCCSYICRLIVRITGDINLLDTVSRQVTNLVYIQQWGAHDVIKLQKQKYREEYLVQKDG